MALISVTAAKGSPGVTTTAMLLASLWPRESLLVDADPDGGDVALRLLGEQGHPLDPERGLLSLVPAARRGMDPEVVARHAQRAIGGQPLLCGLPGPEQAMAVGPLWSALAGAFARLEGVDAVADLGRLHGRSAHLPMLEAAAAVVLVYRPTAWSAVHTRRRLEGLAAVTGERRTLVGIVAVADARDRRDQQAAAESILRGLDEVRDLGVVAWDPKAVAMFSGGTVHRPERSLIARSGAAVAARLAADLELPSAPEPAPPETVGRRGVTTP